MAPQEAVPEHIRGLPQDVQIAVLYERVKNLGDEVKALKRALWSFVFSILGGALLFLLSLAAGWIGPNHGVSGAVGAAWKWLGL
jgi:hypothetical protein